MLKENVGHISFVTCRDLCRPSRLKRCPICRTFKEASYCLECGKQLSGRNQSRFCSRSCNAKYNNKKRRKVKYCLYCGKELDASRYKNKFCNNSCHAKYMQDERVKKWKEHPELETRETKIPYIKRYLMEKYDNSCQLCGWNKVHPITGKVPLEIHHINGTASDNREENLQLLCPNCHSLTETYRGLNMGSGRKKRY